MVKRNTKVKAKDFREEAPLGSVFNPHVITDGYRVHFEYEPGSYFECYLNEDRTLTIRTSGRHSDRLGIRPNVSNQLSAVALRWSTDEMRHKEFIKTEC